jgi:hypothetical protein
VFTLEMVTLEVVPLGVVTHVWHKGRASVELSLAS